MGDNPSILGILLQRPLSSVLPTRAAKVLQRLGNVPVARVGGAVLLRHAAGLVLAAARLPPEEAAEAGGDGDGDGAVAEEVGYCCHFCGVVVVLCGWLGLFSIKSGARDCLALLDGGGFLVLFAFWLEDEVRVRLVVVDGGDVLQFLNLMFVVVGRITDILPGRSFG